MADPEYTNISKGVDALMETFKQVAIGPTGCGKTALANQVMIILFMERAFDKTGLDRKVYKSGGKFDELLAAHQLNSALSPNMAGPDLFDNETGAATEIKVSNVSMDTKTNFNFTAPVRANGVTNQQQHKQQTLQHYIDLGDVLLYHKPDSKTTYAYKLGKEFVGHMVWHLMPKAKTPHKVNIGAKACPRCKHIHRCMYYMQLESEFVACSDKQSFDFGRLNVQINSATGCDEYASSLVVCSKLEKQTAK